MLAVSPDPSGQYPTGTEFTLTVSSGKELVDVPDVVTVPADDAADQLKKLGFQVGYDDRQDPNAVDGTVLKQSVKAGTKAAEGQHDHPDDQPAAGEHAVEHADADRTLRRGPEHATDHDRRLTSRTTKQPPRRSAGGFSFVRRQLTIGARPAERATASGSPQIASQLASIRWPPSVSTDSGWNCTPSTGRSRCRAAMITPASVRAVTCSSSGTVSCGDRQRVVPGRGERRRQSGEHAGALVEHLAGLAVQQLVRAPDDTAVRDADRLQAEADAEDRDLAALLLDDVHARAGLFRRTGAGREQDSVVLADLVRGDLVVAQHGGLGLQLLQVLHQVVDEGVVVVDDKDPRHADHCDSYGDRLAVSAVGLTEGVRSNPGTVALCRSRVPSYAGIGIDDSLFTSYPSWNFTT